MDRYNKHYIRIDANRSIVKGFSDAFEQAQEGDICINDQGGYQFRLFPGGPENPALYNEHGVPLYQWDGSAVIARSPQELEADMPPEQDEQTPNKDMAGGIEEAPKDGKQYARKDEAWTEISQAGGGSAPEITLPHTWSPHTEIDFGIGCYGMRFTGTSAPMDSTVGEHLLLTYALLSEKLKLRQFGGNLTFPNYWMPGFGRQVTLGSTDDKISVSRIYVTNDLEYSDVVLDVLANVEAQMDYDVWILFTKG